MKLYSILEARALYGHYSPDVLTQYKDQISKVMPSYKTKHSVRVANHLAKAGAPKHVVDAGLFHDYHERGGNPADLQNIGLHDRAHPLIQHMTNPNKDQDDDPMAHLAEIMPGLDEETRNHLILVKLSDRTDNLHRRIREKRLSKPYLKYSRKLIKWLVSNYTGSPLMLGFMMRKLQKLRIM